MKILLTNDDGIEAEGLQRFYELLKESHDCYVVAPDQGRSCCGHAVTTGHSLEVIQRSERSWSVSGTPADCVRVAILHLKLTPQWILSGINHGGNLGVDILYSGTVAAAREACQLGFPSIAISQYMRRDIERDWDVIAKRARHTLDSMMGRPLATGQFWNVNLPAIVPEIHALDFPITQCEPEILPLDFSFEWVPPPAVGTSLAGSPSPAIQHVSTASEPNFQPFRELDLRNTSSNYSKTHQTIIYKSNYQQRPRKPGSDVDLCFQGHATFTCLPSCPTLHKG